ncbi:MAG: acyloxyacyl hydrolase [Nitrospirae bacterium]|nr:MAG: acyloxyacyl hydrolase [Nitrospirota bacterium]
MRWMNASGLLLSIGLTLIGVGSGWAATGHARENVNAGTVEVGFLSGYWQGNNLFGNEPSANRSAVLFLPRVGLVVTDELGTGWFRGNVEVMLEPLAAHFFHPFSASAFGGTAMAKYNFLSFGRWMPFWDGGAGMLWTDLAPRIPEQSTRFNFVLQTGPGVQYFLMSRLTMTAGVRFHHISNAGIGARNIGLNAWLFNVGVSYFFPR